MSLPGLFVEYLVEGSFALIWLLPLLLTLIPTLQVKDTILLFVPGLYVMGLMIDYISGILFRPFKRFLIKKVSKEYNVQQLNDPKNLIEKLGVYAPALLVRRDMYTSRARIARGATFNVLIATILLTIYSVNTHDTNLVIGSLVGGVIVFLICAGMWVEYRLRSYRHEEETIIILKELQKTKKQP